MPATHSDNVVGLVGLEDIQDGGRGGITIRSTRPEDILSLKTRFEAGDILYGKLRPYLNKVGIAPQAGLCSTEIWAFGPSDLVDSQFAAFFLASTFFVDRVASLTKGANLPRLDAETFDSIEIPLPPMSEQRRIVEILQEADAIRRLRAEAEAKAANLIPALYRSMFLEPVTKSEWPERTVAQIAARRENSIRTGPFGSDLLHSEFVDSGIPVLAIDNVVTNHFRWSERRYITPAKYSDLSRFRVFPGDVMVSIMGTVGRAAIAPSDLPEAISTKHLCVITPDTAEVLPSFLWATLLYNPSLRAQTRAVGKGAIMEGWNSTIIRQLRFRRPPLGLQEEFDARLSEILAVQETFQGGKENELTSSLSANAFSGELTAGWRDANADLLAGEARERDDALKAAGVRYAHAPAAVVQEDESPDEVGPPGDYDQLNREQRNLLTFTRDMVAAENRYFTSDEIAATIEGPLRGHPNAVSQHLTVLATHGFVVMVSLQKNEGTWDYAHCYRLATPEDNVRAARLESLKSIVLLGSYRR